MFPSAPIFQQYNYFRQNLEEKSLSLSIFISFASNFLCKILLNNKNIDANIWIFQISFSQWMGGLLKKLFWGFFLAVVPFVTPKNFNLNRPPLHVFCPYLLYFWQISLQWIVASQPLLVFTLPCFGIRKSALNNNQLYYFSRWSWDFNRNAFILKSIGLECIGQHGTVQCSIFALFTFQCWQSSTWIGSSTTTML